MLIGFGFFRLRTGSGFRSGILSVAFLRLSLNLKLRAALLSGDMNGDMATARARSPKHMAIPHGESAGVAIHAVRAPTTTAAKFRNDG